MNEIKPAGFEQENLVIESDRVLIYSDIICPLGCKYCFVDDLKHNKNSQNFYLSDKQFALLKNLPENIHTIMLGCDTEFLFDKYEAIRVLNLISTLGKDVSIITKLNLDDDLILKLKDIYEKMKLNNNVLSFSISIPCFEDSNLWEPNAPGVQERINTLEKVSNAGIPSLVAIRPLIPSITEAEIDEIIKLTYSYTLGYYSGPLYIKNLNNGILTEQDLSNPDISITETQPEWMPEGNIFFKIENPKIMLYLRNTIEKYGKVFLEGAAQGIDLIKTKQI